MLFSSAIGIWMVFLVTSECFAEELTDNVSEEYSLVQGSDQDAHTQGYQPKITQGAYVGLRYVWKGRSWLAGWPTRHVGTATCPGVYFSGNKVRHCWGEVFKIFRQRRGPIKVGDKVALYYPHNGRWFGCPRHYCGVHTCPGRPTYAYGFQNRRKWRQCWGEVFKIAVMNKRRGEVVQHKDPVMLYYPRKRRYVGANSKYIKPQSCPGGFPPATSRWEPCWGEVFEIHLLKRH